MTGAEIQERLGEIVTDLQTNFRHKQTQIAMRGADGLLNIYPLSSDANGVVDAGQLASIQSVLDTIKPLADEYTTRYAPVQTTAEAYRTTQAAHQTLIDAASVARETLNDALEADDLYQDAKEDYDAARENPAYVAARNAYRDNFVSENYGNLSDAKGTYIEV